MTDYFFLTFLVTVIITRLFLFLCPIPSPTIGKLRIHHYMYGVTGIVIGLLLKSIFLYAVGLGLFVDEITYLIIHGKNHEDNYSKISLLGTFFFILLVYILRGYFILGLLY